MSIQALREQRAAKLDEINALLSKKNWNEARDKPIYDAGLAEVDALNKQIERMNVATEQAIASFMKAHGTAIGADTDYWQTEADKFPVMNKGSNFKAIYGAEARNDEPVSLRFPARYRRRQADSWRA